ncbi:MAG: hypothetical protein ABJC19_01525, partial [Gemmatimonadota bacterium]
YAAPPPRRRAYALIVALAAMACSESGQLPTEPVSPLNPTTEAAISSVEIPANATRLVALGRALRTAMLSQPTRTSIAAGLDYSPYVEWRIPLSRVLDGRDNDGAAIGIRSQLADRLGQSATVAMPELELYLPFADQRRAWDGSSAVDIAARFPGSDDGVLIGADGQERRIVGGERFVPNRPMFVLARSEVDYTDFESAVRGGKRTGIYANMSPIISRRFEAYQECQEDCGDGGGSGGVGGGNGFPGNTSQHTRIYDWYLQEDHDFPWGLNEIEFFGAIGTHFQECARHTGIAEDGWYTVTDIYDFNNTVATAMADSTVNFFLHAYEDDQDACEVTSSDDDLGTANFGPSGYGQRYSTTGDHLIFSVIGVTP